MQDLVRSKNAHGGTHGQVTDTLRAISTHLAPFLHPTLADLLPSNSHEIHRKILKDSTPHEEIHLCPNECVMFRGEYKNETKCPKCGCKRFKGTSKFPVHVFRYIPMIPRLIRLFKNEVLTFAHLIQFTPYTSHHSHSHLSPFSCNRVYFNCCHIPSHVNKLMERWQTCSTDHYGRRCFCRIWENTRTLLTWHSASPPMESRALRGEGEAFGHSLSTS